MFECNLCGKKFSKRKGLSNHIQNFHERHKCIKCDQTFSTKKNIQKHLEIFHKIFRFQCNKCEKKYSQKADLEVQEGKMDCKSREFDKMQ